MRNGICKSYTYRISCENVGEKSIDQETVKDINMKKIVIKELQQHIEKRKSIPEGYKEVRTIQDSKKTSRLEDYMA